MKKSNLYTRTGDLGTTSLVGGQRVSKATARLEAYGTVDELNANLGVIASDAALDPVDRQLILFVQHKLFTIGAYLATEQPEGAVTTAQGLGMAAISRLEQRIDTLDETVPPLNRFVLPGGTPLSALTHVARTVCRRAERRIVALSAETRVDPDVIRFVNRISDYLFVLSRYINHRANVEELFWDKDC